jgi:hypothetical protein
MEKYRIMEEKSVKQILTVLCRLLKLYFYMQIMKFLQKQYWLKYEYLTLSIVKREVFSQSIFVG